jgi:IS30 family transposase
MGLPKCHRAVVLGKRPSGIYRELNRNRTGGVFAGTEAHKASAQRRMDTKGMSLNNFPLGADMKPEGKE